MVRRSWFVGPLCSALLVGLLPAAALAETPPLPDSIVALGDSISQAASSGGSLGEDYPANSWSTGTSTSVDSHYLRLLALNPDISGRNHNGSVSGARMVDLLGQVQQVVPLQPDYATILIGGNDLCTDTVDQMPSVATFQAQFQVAMDALTSGSPATNVYVVSIPRVYRLWELFHGNWWARVIWSFGDVCQSLLANPTSTQSTDVARRQMVAQRNIDYNAALAEVCAAYPRCRFDGNAVYNTDFDVGDAAGDYFHPSVSGQAKLAAVSWAAGFWAGGAPPPPTNQDPIASFTSSCTELTCTVDATASTDPDGSIVAYAWDFGGDGSGDGVLDEHTFSAPGEYAVSLMVTDDAGASAATTQLVSVTAAPPPSIATVSVADLDGSASTRRGGWTARVTISTVDDSGAPVPGATVSGSWSSGGSSSCVTGSAGTCTVSTNVNKKTTGVTWTVVGISHPALAYDPAANLEDQVTIVRP